MCHQVSKWNTVAQKSPGTHFLSHLPFEPLDVIINIIKSHSGAEDTHSLCYAVCWCVCLFSKNFNPLNCWCQIEKHSTCWSGGCWAGDQVTGELTVCIGECLLSAVWENCEFHSVLFLHFMRRGKWSQVLGLIRKMAGWDLKVKWNALSVPDDPHSLAKLPSC